ncbi:MAG: tRNA (adenosine(37)-N6)-dimethylallyltransferase MiaA [SAR202 cluster bacterium Io17-Chloro-G9]|nr:MAG: tRNA (adenosine(37)-N6)-dimethylallyltransferase MiaA [SAR202 cluster bacterium Io17-Chloro-G9]
MQEQPAPVLFIVGPTGVGKTRLAVALAQRFRCEIVNADSRQVYRHMDIGTAKPTAEERRQAPHHLLDLLDPDQGFGLGSFLPLAASAITGILERGRLPMVVGGTGQYIWALLEGWDVPQVPPDPEFRRSKQAELEQDGPLALHQELQRVDSQRAAELDPRNTRRVIRALEVHNSTGRPHSDFGVRSGAMRATFVLGLTMDRRDLYRRIDHRVDQMLADGLEDEVRRLQAMGLPMGKGPLASPGYVEMGQYLAGDITLDQAVQRAKFRTHRLARRQYAWFKLTDQRITWLDAAALDVYSQAVAQVTNFLNRKIPCDTIGENLPRSKGTEPGT